MTMLICPVRPGDSNEELRYALRSWETNLHLPDGLELVTVGYKPTWLEPDHHVEGNRYESVPLAVWDNVLLGSAYAVGRDMHEALYMNDDFFCLDPVGSVLPVCRNVSLEQHVAQFPVGAGLWWPRSLDLTARWLSDRGIPHPPSYEVHRPLVASPHGMIWALEQWDGGVGGDIPQWRTMYGALNKVEAYPVQDVKLGMHLTGMGSAWVSTSDQSWRKYRRLMEARFQKPSRWEN